VFDSKGPLLTTEEVEGQVARHGCNHYIQLRGSSSSRVQSSFNPRLMRGGDMLQSPQQQCIEGDMQMRY